MFVFASLAILMGATIVGIDQKLVAVQNCYDTFFMPPNVFGYIFGCPSPFHFSMQC